MKGVQCNELFGGIALKNHTFSFFLFSSMYKITIIFFVSVKFHGNRMADTKMR